MLERITETGFTYSTGLIKMTLSLCACKFLCLIYVMTLLLGVCISIHVEQEAQFLRSKHGEHAEPENDFLAGSIICFIIILMVLNTAILTLYL